MLLFHGARADALPGILERGLAPPSPEDHQQSWARQLSGYGHSASVYLSTSPVAGKGGDPVSFALGWPGRRWRVPRKLPGYLIVVDLPTEAHGLIRAAVPNIELDRFMQTHHTRDFLLGKANFTAGQRTGWLFHWQVLYWLERFFRETGVPLEQEAVQARLRWQVTYRVPELPEDLTPRRWQAFLTEYVQLMELKSYDLGSQQEVRRQQARLFRRHQLTLPADILEDSHSAQCRLCLAALFQYSYLVEGFEAYAPFSIYLREHAHWDKGASSTRQETLSPYTIPVTSYNSGMLDYLALMLRVVRAHVAPFTEADLLRFWQAHPRTWTWQQWYHSFPAERCNLPNLWRPTYGRDFTPHDLKQPDWQVLTAAIPRAYLLGAIKLSDGDKLLPQVRPNRLRGETLSARLWQRVHELRSSYQGQPLVW